MQPESKARAALDEAIGFAVLNSRRWAEPGGVVKRLPEVQRALLRQLSSDDVRDVREDLVFDDERTAARRRYREMLAEFDKRLRR